jgi:hypothetical protein
VVIVLLYTPFWHLGRQRDTRRVVDTRNPAIP